MAQEEKELLLKDLSARLPYKVMVKSQRRSIEMHLSLDILNDFYLGCVVKPYLRPMSSMTEEEYKEYMNIDNRSYSCPMDYAHIPASDRIDWLNAHHFDYRGLIEKGLAIEVPKDNNPYKYSCL